MISHLLDKQLDYRDLYTTRSTFISPALAALSVAEEYKKVLLVEPAQTLLAPLAEKGLVTDVSIAAMQGTSGYGRSSDDLVCFEGCQRFR